LAKKNYSLLFHVKSKNSAIMRNKFTRRKFFEKTIGAGIIITGAKTRLMAIKDTESVVRDSPYQYDAKGLPTAVLGKTGVVIPRMAVGLGSRFLNIANLDTALEMCHYALDNGLYYWDTAHSYVNEITGAVSEERLGHIVKDRRKEIFLSTKVEERDPVKAKVQIEKSLERLQTDHLDMLKIHSVETPDDVNNICKPGGVLDVITGMKRQGITRFIGFSGHGNALALKNMIDTDRFDSMLFAMNHYSNYTDKREEILIPAAKQKGMGVMLMKTIRPKETIQGINANELVRFGLSIEGPDGIIVGMDSKKVVESNLNLLRNFKPMTSEEKTKFAYLLTPYFRHENLEWMQHGYHDGYRG
jgi:uncharacterized protein